MEKQYIIVKDSFLQSIITDSFTYGGLFVLFFFNNKYLGDSWVIDWFALIMLISFGRNSFNSKVKRINGKENLKKYIDSL